MILINPSKELKDTTTDASRIHANWVFAQALKSSITYWGDSCILSRNAESASAGNIEELVKYNNITVTITVECNADIGLDVRGYDIECNKLNSLVTTISYAMHRHGLSCIHSRGYKETNKNLVSKVSDITIYLGYITNEEDAIYLTDDDYLRDLAVDIIDASYGPPVRTYEEELQPANDDPYFYSSNAWTEDKEISGFTGIIGKTTYQGLPVRYLEITGGNVDTLACYTWSIPLHYTEPKTCYFIASIQAADGEVTAYIKVGSKDYTFNVEASTFITKNILVDVTANSRVYIGIQGPGTIKYSGVWVSEIGSLGTLDDPRMDYSIFPAGYRTEVIAGAYTNTDALTVTITNAASFLERALDIIDTKIRTEDELMEDAVLAEYSSSISYTTNRSTTNNSSSYTNLVSSVNSLTSATATSSSSTSSNSSSAMSSVTSKALSVASGMLISAAGVLLSNMKNSDNTQCDTKDLEEYIGGAIPSEIGDAASKTLTFDKKTALATQKQQAIELKDGLDAATDSLNTNTAIVVDDIKAQLDDENSAESAKSKIIQEESANKFKAGAGLITDVMSKALETKNSITVAEAKSSDNFESAYKAWSEWFTGWPIYLNHILSTGQWRRYVSLTGYKGSDGGFNEDFWIGNYKNSHTQKYKLYAFYIVEDYTYVDSIIALLKKGLSTPPLAVYGVDAATYNAALTGASGNTPPTLPNNTKFVHFPLSSIQEYGEQLTSRDAKLYKRVKNTKNPNIFYQYLALAKFLTTGDVSKGNIVKLPEGITPDLSRDYTYSEIYALLSGSIPITKGSDAVTEATSKVYTTVGTISSGEITNKAYFKFNNNTLIYETLTLSEKDEFIASGTYNKSKLDDGTFELNLISNVDLTHNLPKDIVDICLIAEGTTNENTVVPDAYKITKAEQRKRENISRIEDKVNKKSALLGQTVSDTTKALQDRQNELTDIAKTAAQAATQLSQKANIIMQVTQGILSASSGISAISSVITSAVTSVTSTATAAIKNSVSAATSGASSLIKGSLSTLTSVINAAAATKETLTPKLDVKAKASSKIAAAKKTATSAIESTVNSSIKG